MSKGIVPKTSPQAIAMRRRPIRLWTANSKIWQRPGNFMEMHTAGAPVRDRDHAMECEYQSITRYRKRGMPYEQ